MALGDVESAAADAPSPSSPPPPAKAPSVFSFFGASSSSSASAAAPSAGGISGDVAAVAVAAASGSAVSVPLLLVLALVGAFVFPWACVFDGGGAGGASPMRVGWPKPRPGPDPRSGALAHGANASAQAGFKTWVEEGMALATLDYDPQITPPYIAEGPPQPCRTGLKAGDNKVRLFLLGDSLNRIMIDDACGALGGSAQRWTSGFEYRVDASPDKLCVTADGVIAFLNIYGSAPRGPYYGGHSSNKSVDDPWADTELRVQHGLDQFTEKFGAPNFIIFRSEVRRSGGVGRGAERARSAWEQRGGPCAACTRSARAWRTRAAHTRRVREPVMRSNPLPAHTHASSRPPPPACPRELRSFGTCTSRRTSRSRRSTRRRSSPSSSTTRAPSSATSARACRRPSSASTPRRRSAGA